MCKVREQIWEQLAMYDRLEIIPLEQRVGNAALNKAMTLR